MTQPRTVNFCLAPQPSKESTPRSNHIYFAADTAGALLRFRSSSVSPSGILKKTKSPRHALDSLLNNAYLPARSNLLLSCIPFVFFLLCATPLIFKLLAAQQYGGYSESNALGNTILLDCVPSVPPTAWLAILGYALLASTPPKFLSRIAPLARRISFLISPELLIRCTTAVLVLTPAIVFPMHWRLADRREGITVILVGALVACRIVGSRACEADKRTVKLMALWLVGLYWVSKTKGSLVL